MGQVLHASATTVQKWRSRQTSTDARMGPKESRSSVLRVEVEAVIVAASLSAA